MRIGTFYDEFFSNNYLRDFRFLGKKKKVCHAPQWQTTKIKQNRYAKRWLLKQRNTKVAKYTRLYGGIAYYKSIIHYQVANEDEKHFNHFFFDFDAHNKRFDEIKHKQNDAIDKLTGKDMFNTLDDLQIQIQDLIFNEDLIVESWNESKIVHDYFLNQGLKTLPCFSGSKGIHLRLYFDEIHLNNYDRIVEDLSHTLIDEFHLKTMDESVSDFAPSKSVERLPYTYNEKSALKVIPFSFEHNSLDDVLDKAKRLSKRRLDKVEDFCLSDYVNVGFSDALLKLDEKVGIIVAKEQKAKEQLKQEQAMQRSVNGTYTGGINGNVKDDLRILVKMVCGTDNLVKEHEHYDKWKCVFHDDKNESAIVSKKYYQCLSSNCKVGKINYYDFIKEWFHLSSDDEIKDKIIELQSIMDGDVVIENANLGEIIVE